MTRPSLPRRAFGSFRVRSAGYILVAVGAAAIVVYLLFGVVQNQGRLQVESTLRAQADTLALTVVRGGRANVSATVGNAARYLIAADTRYVVSVDGVDQFWNVPRGTAYARASATRGWATVTLERIDPVSTVDRTLLVYVIALGVGSVAFVTWFLSGALTRTMRRSMRELVTVAERVSEGDLTARATEVAGEPGVVAKAFNRMAKQLDESDARQRAFLADAAHELRTPVTAIEGFASALADGTARSDEDRRESAETIRDEAVRLRSLVRDLQQLTWLDLDPPVNRDRVDLVQVIEQVILRHRLSALEREVILEGPRDGETLPVDTDPEHIATIVGNLISNAISATPPKGKVRVSVAGHGRDAIITVADTGVGIDPEKLPFIFDRLFRADDSRRRDGMGGSGLGLAIVHRLVMLIDGRIDVESTPGVGTIFTVRLRGARSSPSTRGVTLGLR